MDSWKDIATVEDLPPGAAKTFDIDNITVAVFNLGGELYAIEDVCTHDGSALLGCGLDPRDLVADGAIACPRHGAKFCIRTGAALTPPAYEPVQTFPIRVRDGIIQIQDLE